MWNGVERCRTSFDAPALTRKCAEPLHFFLQHDWRDKLRQNKVLPLLVWIPPTPEESESESESESPEAPPQPAQPACSFAPTPPLHAEGVRRSKRVAAIAHEQPGAGSSQVRAPRVAWIHNLSPRAFV